eukprot:64852-Hanusia_phi.AAC.9
MNERGGRRERAPAVIMRSGRTAAIAGALLSAALLYVVYSTGAHFLGRSERTNAVNSLLEDETAMDLYPSTSKSELASLTIF